MHSTTFIYSNFHQTRYYWQTTNNNYYYYNNKIVSYLRRIQQYGSWRHSVMIDCRVNNFNEHNYRRWFIYLVQLPCFHRVRVNCSVVIFFLIMTLLDRFIFCFQYLAIYFIVSLIATDLTAIGSFINNMCQQTLTFRHFIRINVNISK